MAARGDELGKCVCMYDMMCRPKRIRSARGCLRRKKQIVRATDLERDRSNIRRRPGGGGGGDSERARSRSCYECITCGAHKRTACADRPGFWPL